MYIFVCPHTWELDDSHELPYINNTKGDKRAEELQLI